jgi:hypothetical protein
MSSIYISGHLFKPTSLRSLTRISRFVGNFCERPSHHISLQMMPLLRSSFYNLLFLLFAPTALAATIGPCHPYPGAAAVDCLTLIGDYLGNDTALPCTGTAGLATLTLGACTITTKCGSSETTVVNDDAVRRALTAIGNCALRDYGSISGYYLADNGAKTCYLYPGK